MATVGDVHRTDVKYLNRINKVSFAFGEQRNAKRSEIIAKRSKTPLKKSNSMMVLRSIDTIEVSAPSPVDVTSSDDVTSSSCSIISSPVSTASSSTGKSRRRRLPSLPTQEAVQGINGASLNGGMKKAGLRRHVSCAWPSRSDAANQRLIPSESVNLPGSKVTRDLGRRDLVNQRPSDLVNHGPNDPVSYRKRDLVNQCPSGLVNHRPGDTLTQSPDDSLDGSRSHCSSNSVSEQNESRTIDKNPNGHQLRDSPHLPRNSNVSHHKRGKVILLQSQLKDASDDRCSSEMKNYNTSQNILQSHKDSINHSQRVEHRLGVKLNTSQDENAKSKLVNGCQDEVMNKSQCVRRDSSDVSCHRQNDFCETSLKIASVSLHDNGSQREVVNNRCSALTGHRPFAFYPNEVVSHFQREKISLRNTESDSHGSSDKFNQCSNEKDKEKEPVLSLSADYATHKLKPHHKKLHNTTSLGEKSSSAEHQFQVSDGIRTKDVSLDSKHGTPSTVSYSTNIIPLEASMVSRPRREISPAFLQTQANALLSDLHASSVDDDDDDEDENDFKVNHKNTCKDIHVSLQQETTFKPQCQVLSEDVSKGHRSLNYLHSQSHVRSNDSRIFRENHQQLGHNPSHSTSPCSSDSFKNVQKPRTASKNLDTKRLVQDAATSRKVSPLNRTNKGSLDNSRRQNEIYWSSSKDTHMISLDNIPDPEYFPNNLTEGSGIITDLNSFEKAYGIEHGGESIMDGTVNTRLSVPESEMFQAEFHRSNLEQVGKDGPRGTTCVPTLHALLQTCRMTAVSLVRSTATEDCGVTLGTVPFGVDTVTCRRPVGLAPKGKRATNLGSPDGAFKPVAAAETSPGRDVQPLIVMVTCVEEGSVAAGSIEEGDFVIEVNGTYVLGSSLDVIERLLTVNSQRLDFVLARPVATASSKSVNGCLRNTEDLNASPPRIVQCIQDELALTTPDEPDQPHSTLEHVLSNFQPQRTSAGSGIIMKPTSLAWSSNRSSETAYTIRPIKEESPSESTITGFNKAQAFYLRRNSYDEILDSDYEWQKISAV